MQISFYLFVTFAEGQLECDGLFSRINNIIWDLQLCMYSANDDVFQHVSDMVHETKHATGFAQRCAIIGRTATSSQEYIKLFFSSNA